MFCTTCGKQLADNAQFCDNCGTPLQTATPQSEPNPIPSGIPVYPETPDHYDPYVPTESPVDVQAPVAAGKKKSWLPIVIGVLAVAIIVTVGILLFGKKTVYLMSESVTTDGDGDKTIVRTEYDEDGRILSIEQIREYDDGDEDYLRNTTYEYDKKGRIERIELEYGERGDMDTIEVEYTYDGKKLDDVDIKFGDDSDYEYDFEFTDDGHIERVEVTSESNTEIYSYEYHKDGKLSSMEREYTYHDEDYGYSSTSKYTYDELGRQVEYRYYEDGELRSKTTTEYDEDISYPVKTVRTNYNEDGETSTYTTRYEFEMKNKKPVEMTMVLESVDYDGEKLKVEISGEIEWDDLEGTWEPKIKGDLEEAGMEDNSIEMEFEMDKKGNLLSLKIYSNGELSQKVENEYVAVKVPRDYDANYTNDPMFSLNWR